MKISATRLFHRSLNKLQPREQKQCDRAIENFKQNPLLPALNFEKLGDGKNYNHHSIRASRELRIILGVEPDMHEPQKVIFAHVDHHDDAYNWSGKNKYYTAVKSGAPINDGKNSSTEQLTQFLNAEEWQLFLHQEQEQFVHKKFFGEARILGAAGTGKTIIALHRAKYLAEIYDGKVLFTTFSASLPQHLSKLYRGIPNAPNNVEFINVDLLANKIIISEKINALKINTDKADDFFQSAYQKCIPGTLLERLAKEYLREEIERVIKGRGVTREEYLNTGIFQRHGRQQRFTKEMREICWNLKEEFDSCLAKEQLTTFADRLIAARDYARQHPPRYRAIIVDEYQDLSLVGVQFLCALVTGDDEKVPDDGLLFVGDVAQRIYAGGWIASDANLSFKGRSDTLFTNYRNTRLIISAAKEVRGTENTGADQNEQITEYKNFPLGDGVKPVFFHVGKKQEIRTIASEIKRLNCEKDIPFDEIAILTYHNIDASTIERALVKHFSIPCFLLKNLRKQAPKAGVRIGTFDRGKGMEFQAVFLPRLGASIFPETILTEHQEIPADNPNEPLSAEQQEHRQLQIDRLYVGMTRAMYFLYLLADEEPCSEIQNAEHFFDWRRG